MENLKNNHQLVITLEDGELDGGFGEKIARFYGTSEMNRLIKPYLGDNDYLVPLTIDDPEHFELKKVA